MLNDLLRAAAPSIATLVGTLLSTALGFLIRKLHKKTKSDYLSELLYRLEDTIRSVTREMQQTVVDALKKRSADGKLDVADALAIRNEALAKVKSYVGPKGLAELAKLLGLNEKLVDSYLITLIEANVPKVSAQLR